MKKIAFTVALSALALVGCSQEAAEPVAEETATEAPVVEATETPAVDATATATPTVDATETPAVDATATATATPAE